MKKYNTEFLVKVIVTDFIESRFYSHVKSKKRRFLKDIEEGFRCKWSYPSETTKELPENHTIIDGVLYENPRCDLFYIDETRKSYNFETYQEALAFAETFTTSDKWID